MSKWIRPKYNEQCRENAHCTNNSVLIDSRKVPKGYWLDLLRDKCPNGLGITSTSEIVKKYDEDLSIDNFLDDIDDFELNKISTPNLEDVPQSTLAHKSSITASGGEKIEKQDILNADPDHNESKQGFSQLDQGFKTPLLRKQKTSTSDVTTPCLFSPDLVSQASQGTPKTHHVPHCTTPDENRLLGSQPCLATMPHSLDKEGLNNLFQSSPDILEQMIAGNRPRSNLAFLSMTNLVDDIDGWSDSMATPPMHWSPSQEGSLENDVEDEKKNEKNVARTLFKGANKVESPELSGFDILDSCEEKHERSSEACLEKHGEANNIDITFDMADDSLLKIVMEGSVTSQNAQVLSIKSNYRKYSDFVESRKVRTSVLEKCDVSESVTKENPDLRNVSQSYSPSQNTTMFPPTMQCTSLFSCSQEVPNLLELAQSTPKVRVTKCMGNHYSANKVDKCTIKVKRSNSKSRLQNRSPSGNSLSLTKRTLCSEVQDFSKMNVEVEDRENTKDTEVENNALSSDCKHELTLEIPLSLQLSVSTATMVDIATSVGDVSDGTFGSLSKSLEEALAKEAEMMSSVTTKASLVSVADKYNDTSVEKYRTEKEGCKLQRLPLDAMGNIISSGTEARDVSIGVDNIGAPLDIVSSTHAVRIEPNLSKTITGIGKQNSPSKVLSIKRSARSKRFSYPIVKRLCSKDEQFKNNFDNQKKERPFSQLLVENESNGKKKNVENNGNGKSFEDIPQEAKSCPPCPPKLRSENLHQETQISESSNTAGQTTEKKSKLEIELVRVLSYSHDKNTEDDGLCSEPTDTEKEVLSEEVTDHTLQLLQENLNIPNKSSGELLFDMDALSQFPYDMISSTPIAKVANSANQQERDDESNSYEGIGNKNIKPTDNHYEIRYSNKTKVETTHIYYAFKSEIGKDVNISEEALKKAKAMFEMENKEAEVPTKKSKACSMTGFKTASGKDLNISEEALKKAKAMFEMENKEAEVSAKKSKPCSMTGFKTASGKDVNISEEALQKAKAMFEMENKEAEVSAKKSKPYSMTGFKTASGKDLNISEEALQKAKAMFEMENKEAEVSAKKSKPYSMTGFKTASGKDLNISEEALQKAKAMFEMENKEAEVSAKKSKPYSMTGFKTASGKDVNISEEALKKAKAMFEMENKEAEVSAKKSKPYSMTGFKTASGKDVNISEEALQKAKAMFEMENKEAEVSAKKSKPYSMTGFKTASGKDVNISEEALQKAKAMIEMENKEAEVPAKKSKPYSMTGFKTASGKDLNISEESLQKAKAMFEMENKEADSTKKSKSCSMTGFKTASGKDVNISEEALQKAKAMFEMENKEAQVSAKKSKPYSMTGFKTASGKDMNISEEALQKAKAMFEMENKEAEVPANKSKPCSMTGFKTASGKDVNISEEALQKAKAMFEMENKEAEVPAKKSKPCSMTGFKTARGKDVNISEEALQKAKAMFEMENKEAEVSAKKSKPCSMTGFKTARGKDVNISEEALQKAKAMFEMENKEAEVSAKKSKPCSMTGFKTASGKDVNISEEALQKAKAMFEMENKEAEVPAKKSKPCSMTGFKTARGKDVNISEEALQKAKAMFEMENKEADGTKKSKSCSMTGFKTASGKDVNISEEALQKAKAMFEMHDMDTICNQMKSPVDVVNKDVKKHSEVKSYIDYQSSNVVTRPDTRESNSKDLEVPSSNNRHSSSCRSGLNPSLKSTNSMTSKTSRQSPSVDNRTCAITSTLMNPVDDNLSREILESSAALLADESFTDFTDYLGVHKEIKTPGRGTVLGKRVTRNPYRSEPQQSQREALMTNARRRYKSFLNNGDESNNPSPLKARSSLQPIKPSPSNVMFDRRSRTSQPSGLRPVVVGPNMCTPLSRVSSSNREGRQLSALNPCVSSPSPQSPLATNKQNETQRAVASIHGMSSKKQFITPYRTQATSAFAMEMHHKESGNGSPQRKKPRLNDPVGHVSIKPQMGYLYRQSTARTSLKQYVNNALPQSYIVRQQLNGVHNDVMAITCDNAESFRFVASNFFSEETYTANQGIRMEDGGLLYIGNDSRIGLEEIERAMLGTPGVDAKLIPHGWIANHYRWIVWKLASMEMAFPQHFAAKCLTPDWLVCQLKYRYDREIDRSHRSALRKILERDDLSSRTMVLCVCSVTSSKSMETPSNSSKDARGGDENQNSNAQNLQTIRDSTTVIEMTDGWYSVNVALDAPLAHLLSEHKIFVGMKLCINGAELIGSDQAVSPLEVPSSLMLRISANSTRRARWDSRLGFQRHSPPFPLPLYSLFPNGGVIGCVDVVVVRRYPVEYMEKMASGTAIFRNSRAEEREAKTFASNLERARETVLAKVQKEFEEASNKPHALNKARWSYSLRDITKLRSGKELYEVYMSASDPSFIEECLDDNQRSCLEDYRRFIQDSKRAELEKMFQIAWDEDDKNVSRRTIVPILKVRVANWLRREQETTGIIDTLFKNSCIINEQFTQSEGRNPSHACTFIPEALLSIWRPTEDVIQLLAEGTRLRIYHLMASESRFRQGLSSLQLSSMRSTRYHVMNIDHSTMDDLYSARKTTPFDELLTGGLALYSEIDLIGCVVSINSHSNSSLQTVYLADEDNNLTAVKFWGGLKIFAVDDLVKPRCLVACTNLVVRSNEHVNCPTLAFNELSTLTLKPRQSYLRIALEYLRQSIGEIDLLMSNAQSLLDQMRRRPAEHTTNMNTSRDCDAPVENHTTNQGLNKGYGEGKLTYRGTTPGFVPQRSMVPTSSGRPFNGQCKECIPPVSPSITSTDNVRRDFKRPRRVTTGSPV